MIHELVACAAAHRSLAQHAELLAQALRSGSLDEAERLRLGAACIRLSLDQAIAERDAWTAMQRWVECARAERQIRSATARALLLRRIANRDYDRVFRAATQATRLRRSHMQRLRCRLQRLAIV